AISLMNDFIMSSRVTADGQSLRALPPPVMLRDKQKCFFLDSREIKCQRFMVESIGCIAAFSALAQVEEYGEERAFMLAKSSTELVRQQNSALVLSVLRREGRLSHTQISEATGLSSATVSAITAELERAAIIGK